MAASDARPVPLKNTAFRFGFSIRNGAGALVTGWAGQDTELSKDFDSFVDATNEAIEIGSSGIGYIDLTAAEMNFDCVIVKPYVSNSGAIIREYYLYPQEADDIRVGATYWAGGLIPTPNVSGVPRVDLTHILGTLLTEGAGGRIAAAFKKLLDVVTPVFTAESINQTGDNYARLGVPAGASIAADIAAIEMGGGGDCDPAEIAGVVIAALSAGDVKFLRTNILLNGNIDKLVVGDAYTVANGTAIQFLIPVTLPYDLETAETRTLRIRRRKGKVIIDDVAVVVATIGSKKYLRFELTPEQMGKLEPGDNLYQFAIRATWAAVGMSPKTVLFGDIEQVLPY